MIVWTCDFRENSGEGKLARLFLRQAYYKKINSSSLSIKIVKILDKFDNIFLINSNSDDAIREKYINEIRSQYRVIINPDYKF